MPHGGQGNREGARQLFRCDFCGEEVSDVHRVALDGEYERLRTPHQVQYACTACSERKENRRLGIERG